MNVKLNESLIHGAFCYIMLFKLPKQFKKYNYLNLQKFLEQEVQIDHLLIQILLEIPSQKFKEIYIVLKSLGEENFNSERLNLTR